MRLRTQMHDAIYVVKSGEFATYSMMVHDGGYPLAYYTEGMILGEEALLRSQASRVSIRCVEDGEVYSCMCS